MPKKRKQSGKRQSERAKVLSEFRQFKTMIRRWADKTRLVWVSGPPFQKGSQYRFVVPDDMIAFALRVAANAGITPTEQRLKMNRDLKEALQNNAENDNNGHGTEGQASQESQEEQGDTSPS